MFSETDIALSLSSLSLGVAMIAVYFAALRRGSLTFLDPTMIGIFTFKTPSKYEDVLFFPVVIDNSGVRSKSVILRAVLNEASVWHHSLRVRPRPFVAEPGEILNAMDLEILEPLIVEGGRTRAAIDGFASERGLQGLSVPLRIDLWSKQGEAAWTFVYRITWTGVDITTWNATHLHGRTTFGSAGFTISREKPSYDPKVVTAG